MENIVDIFRSVIEGLGTTITINSVTLTSPGVYSLALSKTKWIRPYSSQKSLATVVTINAVAYDVTAVVYNESITITTATDLVALFNSGVTTLSIAAPKYINGTQLAVQNERKNKNSWVQCPFVWLVEPFIANENVDRMKIVGATPDLTICFLDIQKPSDWTTAQHYAYVIQPMDELVEAFKHKLLTTRAKIGKISNWRAIRRAKFGKEAENGSSHSILNENLSGVEVRFTVEILKQCVCT